MRAITRGSLKAGWKVLQRNRVRSFLTMLGVIIGVASVISVVAIGVGVKRQITHEYNHVGADLVTVRGGQSFDQLSNGLGVLGGLHVNGTLGAKDEAVIKQATAHATVVPLSLVSGALKSGGKPYSDIPVVATTSDLPSILNQNMAYGTFFGSDNISDNVAVLGQNAALKLFGTVVPLGQTFSFRGTDFTVSGIFNEFASVPLANDLDFNSVVFIPDGAAQQLTNHNTQPYEILVKPGSANQVDQTVSETRAALLKNHGDVHDFSVLKTGDQLAAANSTVRLLTQLTTGVAIISLLVGGVGIMNITLVSVTERMHEVGIRKAVGATNRQILGEFMAEAVVLSVTGGIIGVIVAGAVDLLLRIYTSLQPVIQWQVVLLATGVSFIVGVIFGTAPALKAARKDPITALRGE